MSTKWFAVSQKQARTSRPWLRGGCKRLRILLINPNAGFDDQGRDRQKLATEEMGRLTGIIEKYNSTSNRWAAPVIKGTVSNDMVGTTQAGRDEVKARIQSGSQEAARGYNQQRPPGPGQI
jgi:hypothetical protein